ncbi:MAG: rod shape-determining protein MreC [Clostridia bacterium]|nr:rod shape-determining protein MreC [Clostridia bacterium]
MKLFRSKLFLFALALVLIACVIMIFAYGTGRPTIVTDMLGAVVTPLERGVTAVTDWLGGVTGYFHRYRELEAENAELRSRIAEYEKTEAMYYAAVEENESLRALSGLSSRYKELSWQLAEVVSVDAEGFQSAVTVNLGSAHGVEAGDCVMTEDGLVGYVSEVGLNYSQVVTIINMDSHISARVSRTREVVVAEGDFRLAGKGQLKLSYLKNGADVRAGDLVETSGAEKYPEGILIGRIAYVEMETHGISSYAAVEPLADITRLKSVFIAKLPAE